MALTPNDVLNKQFQTTKFRDGYDQDEVDDFLDEVLAEFQRLIAENEQIKSQVGAGAGADAASSGEADALRAELDASKAQLADVQAQLADVQAQLKSAQDEAASGSPMLDGMNSAEYLQLARRVHEEHVREGVAKRDEAIAEGETKAAQIIADAQAKHEQLVGDAESKAQETTSEATKTAETLVSEARTKSDELLAETKAERDTQLAALAADVKTLGDERDGLQTSVDELKEFERTYRSSLKTYLTAQLGELDAIGADTQSDDAGSAAAEDQESDIESTDTGSSAVEDTSSQPGTSFQWEPPSRSFESPSPSQTPPASGFGGN